MARTTNKSRKTSKPHKTSKFSKFTKRSESKHEAVCDSNSCSMLWVYIALATAVVVSAIAVISGVQQYKNKQAYEENMKTNIAPNDAIHMMQNTIRFNDNTQAPEVGEVRQREIVIYPDALEQVPGYTGPSPAIPNTTGAITPPVGQSAGEGHGAVVGSSPQPTSPQPISQPASQSAVQVTSRPDQESSIQSSEESATQSDQESAIQSDQESATQSDGDSASSTGVSGVWSGVVDAVQGAIESIAGSSNDTESKKEITITGRERRGRHIPPRVEE